MYNKNLYSFIDSLVDSDFLLLKKESNGTCFVCNPYEIIKNIKEMSSLITRLNSLSKFKVIFYCENINVIPYLKLSIKELGLESTLVQVTSNGREILTQNTKNIVFVIGSCNPKLIHYFLESGIYTLYFISRNQTNFVSGSYNMLNDISSLKKIVFFIGIISKLVGK
jgi:hypothetical protein